MTELFDQIMRMNRFVKSSDIVRLRAIVIAAFAFSMIQFFNLIQMWFVYGGWSLDASISLGSIAGLFVLGFSFRYHRHFWLAAVGFTVMAAAGILLSAMENSLGINSSLVPFLPIVIFMSGFVSGWRMSVFSGIVGLAVIAGLYQISAGVTFPNIVNQELIAQKNYHRFIQAALSCLMATGISALVSLVMHGLFKRDEDNLVKVKIAEQKRTAFLSSLSHEIRTPLNGILGMTHLLMKTEMSNQQNQYANMVKDCSDKLLEVVGNVMEISQIDSARMMLKPETIDIPAMAKNLIKHHAETTNQTDVFLGLHIAPDVPKFLHADRKRIELVINNLLTNAINFTSSGSVNLLLNGTVENNDKFKLCVYVRDTGAGIKKDDLKRIYEPFHQLDNSLSRDHEGTGLGLSLCKEIIEFMGGRIDVASEVGVGSTFFFELSLPIKQEPEETLRLVAVNSDKPVRQFGRRKTDAVKTVITNPVA